METPPAFYTGYIYKLYNINDDSKFYIGSTKCNLRKRLYEHKFHSQNSSSSKYGRPLYVTIRDDGGIQNYNIVEVSRHQVHDKQELEAHEYKTMKELNSTLNFKTEQNTYPESYGKKISESLKKFRADNPDFQRGKNSPSFKGGYVCKDKSRGRDSYRFVYSENGKDIKKSFSCNKYGEDGAKKLAEEEQKKYWVTIQYEPTN